MSEVEILLLGTPVISVVGRPLVTDTRKATALLAYLAVNERPVSRERLSDLLWPEVGQKKARASLRRTLSVLSAARSGGWLLAGREDVSLDMGRVSTDVARFHALLSRGDTTSLAEAATLYRDDFMAGFSLRDSAVFDDWQFFEGESLRQALAGALERLSGGASLDGDWEAATAHARRWLSLDRLHEPAHRRLMEIHARAGRRGAALKQYAECEEILGTELGVSPLEETKRLYSEIRRDAMPPLPEKDSARKTIPEDSQPDVTPDEERRTLFGREAELESLHRAYERGVAVISIEGEAGIGKTRLAREFVSRVANSGAVTVSVSCYESERNLAYGPIIQAIDEITSNPECRSRMDRLPKAYLVEASRLAQDLAPSTERPQSLDTPGARSRFFEGVTQVLSVADHGLFFVDDVHLSDASSLELLAYLARRLGKLGGVRLLITRRDDEIAGDEPLGRFRSEVRKSGGLHEVRVGRLEPEAVAGMASVVGEVSPEIGRRLFRETEGVPLFVGEYLRAMSSGLLSSEEEVWLPPGGVREVILGRLEAAGETARQVLGAAAVVGRSFDFDTVREASGRGEEEVLEAIEALTRKALISEVGEPGVGEAAYDFSHGLLREIVYEQTSLARRRILHRRVADHLASRTRQDFKTTSSAIIARHHRLAGQDSRAVRYFTLAGEEARSLYANAEAISHFEAALELGHPEGARLLEEIGDLRTLEGDYESAIASYRTASPEADTDRARLERKLGGVYQRLGEWTSAEGHYLRAIKLLGTGDASPEKAMLSADLGLLSHSIGDHIEAVRYADESLLLAEETRDALTIARTHSVAAVVARGDGDLSSAREHLERSLASSGEVGDPSVRIAALNNLALVLGESGENEEAISTAAEALILCEKLGDRHREAALRNNLADLCYAAGREGESREHLRRAVEVFAEIGGEDLLRPGIWRLVEW